VTLGITVPPGRRQEIVEVFWSLLGPIRADSGCRTCGLYQEVGNEETLLYVEEWEKAEPLEHHMRSGRYERLLCVMEASARPPVLRYYTVSDVRGLEYLEAVRLGVRPSPPLASEKLLKEEPPGPDRGRLHDHGPWREKDL
jgi:quinol monooxygenase YgiN